MTVATAPVDDALQTGVETAPVVVDRAARPRLDYLDGLRALAALYVMVGHCFMRTQAERVDPALEFTPGVRRMGESLLLRGYYAVVVFIVISGFCLMLPVVANTEEQLPGGVGGYLRRRCRRILPPYYAALAGSVLLISSVSGVRSAAGTAMPLTISRQSLGAHLLLVHNFQSDGMTAINPPMWSIAVEWQLYFAFPVLIAIWRRWGIGWSVLAAAAPWAVLHREFGGRFDYWQTQFLAFFAFGMVGAAVVFSRRRWMQLARERAPWSVIAVGMLAGAILVGRYSAWVERHYFIVAWLVALAAMGFIVHCGIDSVAANQRGSTWTRRLLETRALVAIGIFSYSLYLCHDPLLACAEALMRGMALGANGRFALMLGVAAPACVAVAYAFHVMFERPFMPGRRALK